MFLAAASAHATTHYVANDGDDSTFCGLQVINGFTCGAKATPCRSIQCAIREADPGDTIIVGPGRYGDLNADGDLADRGESPSPTDPSLADDVCNADGLTTITTPFATKPFPVSAPIRP